MAKGRMLDKSISTSRKLSRLPLFENLLFTWIIPHCDDYGRMEADALGVKATVVPRRPETVEQVEDALNVLAESGLILLYQNDGEVYLQVMKWEEHQYFRPDRPRTKSNIPEPSTELPRQTPGNAGKVSTQIKLNQVKLNQINTNKGGKPPEAEGVVVDQPTKIELAAMRYIQIWNQVNNTNYSAIHAITNNLEYWLTIYTPEEISRAIQIVPHHDFWAGKMEPETLLRQKNQNREKVDYIGKMLNYYEQRKGKTGKGLPIKNLK